MIENYNYKRDPIKSLVNRKGTIFGESNSSSCVPSVVVASLVSCPVRNSRRCTESSEATVESADIQPTTSSSTARIVDSNRFASIRRRFRDKGFSKEVVSCCSMQTVKPRDLLISQPGTPGSIDVLKGFSIPCLMI